MLNRVAKFWKSFKSVTELVIAFLPSLFSSAYMKFAKSLVIIFIFIVLLTDRTEKLSCRVETIKEPMKKKYVILLMEQNDEITFMHLRNWIQIWWFKA